MLFNSFFMGGFECSTHKTNNVRLDLIQSTKHDIYAKYDYQKLITHNILTVRDGLRWHLIEKRPGCYDWSSFLPMLQAAKSLDMQVIWDLCHYGWPDDVDIWSPKFITRFTNFAKALAQLIKDETATIPFYTPLNEISFWSWAGGEVGFFYPHNIHRGFELKIQLVRATIEAISAIKTIEPKARFVQPEPLINIVDNIQDAATQNEAQYQACDMLQGKIWPGLGGSDSFLDIVGINYYPYNQWLIDGTKINSQHILYKHFSVMLKEVYTRYKKPIFIAETGAEGDNRVPWLRYICDQVKLAIIYGIPVEGICLYPILDYPAWDDYRQCQTGLYGFVDNKHRPVYQPLANEIAYQSPRFIQ